MRLNKTFTNNFVVIVLIIFIVLFLLIARYIYNSFIDLSDQNSTNSFIQTNTLEFSDLPSYIQSEYILKYECPKAICKDAKPIIQTISKIDDTKITQLQKEITNLEKKLSDKKIKTITKVDNTKVKELEKTIKNLEKKLSNKKVKIVKQIVEVPASSTKNKDMNIKEFFENPKFKIAKCYDMNVGESSISKSCTNKITKLLNNTKEIKYLVIIGVVDKADMKMLDKYKSKYVRNILQSGLAFKRVEDTIWTIRDKIKNKIKIFPSNYKVVSKYKNRGVVVRAFY